MQDLPLPSSALVVLPQAGPSSGGRGRRERRPADWKWQLANALKSAAELAAELELSAEERAGAERA